MAHTSTLVQSDNDLYVVSEEGGSTALTLPSTVTMVNTRLPRFEVNGVHAVVVNSVDRPVIVDDAGIVLFLSPLAPTVAPTVAVGTAGALTGTYLVKYTFVIQTLDGALIAESGFSPQSLPVVLTADKLAVSVVQTMPGLTSAIDSRYEIIRRFYRTTNGTTTFFKWFDISNNTATTAEDDTTDAALATLSAPTLGTVPFLSLIASFRDRLFGVNDSENREILLYTAAGRRWAWPDDNYFIAPQIKGDAQSGITALMPRGEALGIAKSGMLLELTGTGDDDFRIVVISTTVGSLNQESVATYRENAYFLGLDGVYRWGDDGLQCMSDGKVRSWFTTDEYFNRDLFEFAFAIIDPTTKSYKLFLCSAGSEVVDRWVELDIESGTWWGPHKTDAYTFASAFRLASHTPLIGIGDIDGTIAIKTDTRSDNILTEIELEAVTTPIKAVDPPETAYWGTLVSEVDPQNNGHLLIYPTVGELADLEQPVMDHDLTIPSVAIDRLGYGRYLKLRFYNKTLGQYLQILGFEIDPVHIVGNRQ